MIIGQGSGIFYNPPDEKGGGEDLEQTMVFGNQTGPNVLDHNIALGLIRILGTGNVEESLFANNGQALTTDNGAFGEAWTFISSIINQIGFSDSFLQTDTNGLILAIKTTFAFGGGQVFVAKDINFTSGNFLNFNSLISTQNVTNNSLHHNSVALGGKNYAIDKPDTVFGENIEIITKAAYKNIPLSFLDKDFAAVKFVKDKIAYAEQFSVIFNNTVNVTWEKIAVPGAPANKEIDILISNTAGPTRNAGIRKVGSALARIGAIMGSNSFTMRVVTNALGEIETFASVFADIDFRVIGVRG